MIEPFIILPVMSHASFYLKRKILHSRNKSSQMN